MPNTPDTIRNLAVLGHGGDGKTTLCEAMLFLSGVIDRMGRVEDGNTTTDYDPEETRRTISISAAMAPLTWKDTRVNLIDVPGYFDFLGEANGPMAIADAALIVLNAVSGVSVGTELAFAAAKRSGVPHAVVAGGMDREHVDFDKTLAQLTDRYGAAVVPVGLPIMSGGAFKGVAGVLENKAWEFSGKTVKEIPVPDDIADRIAELREAVIEAAAGADEALMEKYFASGELSDEEIAVGMKKGVAEGLIVPVIPTAAPSLGGIAFLLDCIVKLMPSPADKPARAGINPKTNAEETRACEVTAPFSAQVFKTVADPFVGKLSLFKVISGTLTGDMQLFNPAAEKNEKAGTLYQMVGKKQSQVDKLTAGDIGAVAKLQYTSTGDTLCDAAKPIAFPKVVFPKPCISLAVTAKKQGEEDKVFSGLHRLEEEDPTFSVGKTTDTNEVILAGQGELHLEVICQKLKAKFGVEAALAEPRIAYRETIRKSAKVQGRHKKQSGGHGQFGDCWVEFEPLPDAGQEFEFVDKIVGGVVPRQFIPAVEKGLRESLPKGVLAGYPLVGIKATLYDGSYHAVDSSEMAFKTAARAALKKGIPMASPVLLEPVYRVNVSVPDDYMGDIIGDMNKRRGRIMGMNPAEEGGQEVVAEVPLCEMTRYATDLRSMTQGRGSFVMTFERYEDVPSNLAQKIIEANKREEEEEE